MKNLLIIMLALIFSASHAQQDKNERRERGHKKEMRQKGNRLSPEQKAELSSKQMTLRLDLNEDQQKEIYAVELEQVKLRKTRFENKKSDSKLNDEERFKRKIERLDNQIAINNKMKSILTNEQYVIWKNSGHLRNKHKKRSHKKDLRYSGKPSE